MESPAYQLVATTHLKQNVAACYNLLGRTYPRILRLCCSKGELPPFSHPISVKTHKPNNRSRNRPSHSPKPPSALLVTPVFHTTTKHAQPSTQHASLTPSPTSYAPSSSHQGLASTAFAPRSSSLLPRTSRNLIMSAVVALDSDRATALMRRTRSVSVVLILVSRIFRATVCGRRGRREGRSRIRIVNCLRLSKMRADDRSFCASGDFFFLLDSPKKICGFSLQRSVIP